MGSTKTRADREYKGASGYQRCATHSARCSIPIKPLEKLGNLFVILFDFCKGLFAAFNRFVLVGFVRGARFILLGTKVLYLLTAVLDFGQAERC